jgi:Fibronectin type III domain
MKNRILHSFLIGLFCLIGFITHATTYTYGSAGWSGGSLPANPLPAADNIVIDANYTWGAYVFTSFGTITVNAGRELKFINNFINRGSLINNGTFITANQDGALDETHGFMQNFGTIQNNAGSSFQINGEFSIFSNENGGTFVNNGTVTNNFQFQNQAGATLTNNTVFSSPNQGGTIINDGTINISGANATMSYYCAFVNQGTINVTSGGTISISYEGTFAYGGTLNWSNGGVIAFKSSIIIPNGSNFIIPSGGTLKIGPDNYSLQFFIRSGGTLTNNGTLFIGTFVLSTIKATGALINNGTATLQGFISVDYNGTFTNNSGGIITGVGTSGGASGGTINNSGTMSNCYVGGATINNYGALIDCNVVDAGILNNTGTITMDSSIARFTSEKNPFAFPSGNFTWNGGTIEVGRNSVWNLGSNLTLTGLQNLEVTGNFNIPNGTTLNVGSTSKLTLNTFGSNIGTITNNGTINNYGKISNNGLLSNASGTISLLSSNATNWGSITLSANPFALPNGTFNWNRGAVVYDNGNLNNNFTVPANAVLDIGVFTINANTTLTNNGTVIMNTLYSYVINNGTFVNNQYLYSYGHTFVNNGTVKGNGTFIGATLNNLGLLAPGLSPGCLRFNDCTLNQYGTTEMEINGPVACTDFDQIFKSGAYSASGVLNINFGYTPAMGSSFQVFSSNSYDYSGGFSAINVTPNTIPVDYEPSTGRIIIAHPCPKPQNITTVSITHNSAQYNWNSISSAASFEVEYRKNEFGSSLQTLIVSTPSVQFNNLLPFTDYQWRVRTSCGSGRASNWTAYQEFRTLNTPVCATPQGLQPDYGSLDNTQATIMWLATSSGTGYELQYKKQSLTTWTSIFTTNLTALLTGLDALTGYEIRIRASCNGGTTFTAWSSTVTFNTVGGSKQNGNWNDPNTWYGNEVPSLLSGETFVKHIVTVNTNNAECNNLTVRGGVLNIESNNKLKVGYINLVNQTGGSSFARFQNGTLNLTGGTLNIGGQLYFGATSTFNMSSGNIAIDGGGDHFSPQGFTISTSSLYIDNNATTNLEGGTIQIFPPFQYNNSLIIEANKDFGNFSNCVGTTVILERVNADEGNYTLGGTNETSNITYYPRFYNLILRGQTTDMSGIVVKNQLIVDQGIVNKTINSTNTKVALMSLLGGPKTLTGSFELINNCGGQAPFLSLANSITLDNTFSLNINTTENATIDLSQFNANTTFALQGNFNFQNGSTIVKGGTLDLQNTTITGLSPTHYFSTRTNNDGTKMGKVLLPATNSSTVTFNLGLIIPNGSGSPTNVYAPVNVISTNNNTDVTISLQTLNVPSGFVAPSIQWNITPTMSNPSLSLTFNWSAAAENPAFTARRNTAKVYHWNGTIWEQLNSSTVTGPNTEGLYSITATGVTQFSPFAVMVPNSPPLAVELSQFTAKANGNKTTLNWQTANETNAQNFDIEKSLDGKNFSKIKEVKANNTPSVYQAFDDNFTESAYYRLKTNDLDGKTDYSKIVFVDKTKTKGIKISKNTEGPLSIETDDIIEQVTLTNAVGQVLKTDKSNLLLMDDIPMGIYIISVKTDKGFLSQKVLRH